MHFVIFRDDDTNATTPIECLEQLYRPFLDRNLPVNLAVIPEVALATKMPDGHPEGYLQYLDQDPNPLPAHGIQLARTENHTPGEVRLGTMGSRSTALASPFMRNDPAGTIPIAANQKLVRYLLAHPTYHVVQHGCHHDYLEFARPNRQEIARRLEHGGRRLREAGFPTPTTFVAPYDRVSRAGLPEIARRFRVLSTGWFELRGLPWTWWPNYFWKKFRRAPHWRVGRMRLLSHPGCLLSYQRDYRTMFQSIVQALTMFPLTVLVTHWWEYFRSGSPDAAFIAILHQTAEYVASRKEFKAISFADL